MVFDIAVVLQYQVFGIYNNDVMVFFNIFFKYLMQWYMNIQWYR